MALEIERKWLLREFPDSIEQEADVARRLIRQAYVLDAQGVVLRVRSQKALTNVHKYDVDKGFVTLKSPHADVGINNEFEMEVPFDSADALVSAASTVITKTRYCIPYGDHMIELDLFQDNLSPLAIIEVEFFRKHVEFTVPGWFGREVTGQKEFSNAYLSKNGLPKNIRWW